MKIGLLLINLGTPDRPEPRSVRRYLRELLSDPLVMDMAPVRRWMLLNLVILPLRPRRSARAYAAVWTRRGSPLLVHGKDLSEAVSSKLGSEWRVELAMRYGNPSIDQAFRRLLAASVQRVIVLPLYPQHAASTRGSAIEAVRAAARRMDVSNELSVVPRFFDEPGFLEAVAGRVREELGAEEIDHVLFSFHGLPKSHIRRADPTGSFCLEREDCCAVLVEANEECYRFQSFQTARLLASELDLGREGDGWSVAFQSRMGFSSWIEPSTEDLLLALPRRGKRRVAVVCPSFVADCLETTEEIGMRAKSLFLEAGGERFILVPCVNSCSRWVDTVARLANRHWADVEAVTASRREPEGV